MKRIAAVVLVVVCGLTALRAQTYPYLETTMRTILTPPDITQDPCNPSIARSLVFDFEYLGRLPGQGTRELDLVVGKTTWDPVYGDPMTYHLTFSYNGGGEYPGYTFFDGWPSPCSSPMYFKRLVFGNLRPDIAPPRKDLAYILSGSPPAIPVIVVHHNSLHPVFPLTRSQLIIANAVDAMWGAFTNDDVYEDLAVSDPTNGNGEKIRIYRNLRTGLLDEQVYSYFEYVAQKIVLAQINNRIDYPVSEDKLDLVGYDGTVIKIWRNDNNNGLPELQAPIDLGMGAIITSIAVADINNDGYNDIVVGYNQGAHLYLNTGGQNPTIHTTPDWDYTIPPSQQPRNHLIAVADVGSRLDEGGGSRNDGWNDLVIIDKGDGSHLVPAVRVFANQRGVLGQPPIYFTPTPQQYFIPPSVGEEEGERPCEDDVMEIGLADVQTNGGLSLVFAKKCGGELYLHWHDGDPAPAPPKNVGWVPDGYHPRIHWTANSERDISGYYIYRRSFGTSEFVLVANVGYSQTLWQDINSSFCQVGCLGSNTYYVAAYDNGNNVSSASNYIDVPQNGSQEKRGVNNEKLPMAYALGAPYPNPFNPSTQIEFELPEAGNVSLAVYDLLGRTVAELMNDYREAGYHSVTWNASGQVSGVYMIRFGVTDMYGRGRFTKVNKLVLMK